MSATMLCSGDSRYW